MAHDAGLTGGAALSLMNAIRSLKESGIGCHLIAPSDGPLIAQARLEGIPSMVITYGNWAGTQRSRFRRITAMGSALLAIPKIMFQVKAWGCHIIYTNSVMICVGSVTARLLRVRHIWHLREYAPVGDTFIFYLPIPLVSWFMRSSGKIVCNSQALADHYGSCLGLEDSKVVYNCV